MHSLLNASSSSSSLLLQHACLISLVLLLYTSHNHHAVAAWTVPSFTISSATPNSFLHHHHHHRFTLFSSIDEENDHHHDNEIVDDIEDDIMSQLDFLSEHQIEQVYQFAGLLVDWNDKINLVSRKDCTLQVVLQRHILPCLLAYNIPDSPLQSARAVVDVGTGGGFPGLPLAICYPDKQFVLLDSVGKKLVAVRDMAQQLGLANVETYHGRAEALRGRTFQVATGRSVSSLPQFCTWMQHLLVSSSSSKENDNNQGHLMYWIGGEIESNVLSKCTGDFMVSSLVNGGRLESDKRILILPAKAVKQIARESGLAVPPTNRITATSTTRAPNRRNSRDPKPKQFEAKQPSAKGAWRRRASNEPKQRGYETFQRYSSSNNTDE